MPTLRIDGREITVEPGSTILEAAGRLGIEIPTLCHLKGIQEEASCLICVVLEAHSGRLLPACAMQVTEGMEILTRTDEVQKARRLALQLLLNAHRGNCLASCEKACPLHLHIPVMIRFLRQGRLKEARQLIQDELVFPGVLGRVCPAYCEKGCGSFRPNAAPEPVGIRSIHRYLSELALEPSLQALSSKREPATHLKVAIAGAGVTGLTAAYGLLRAGYPCYLFEAKRQPGGRLREEFPENVLAEEVLNREIQVIRDLGAQFHLRTQVGQDITLEELRNDYAAVILAWGKGNKGTLAASGLVFSESGLKVEAGTYVTNLAGVFAGGTGVHSGQSVIRSVADGKGIAAAVQHHLQGEPVTPSIHRFISHSKKSPPLQATFGKHQNSHSISGEAGFDQTNALREVDRCLECSCSKAESCKLRQYATDYQIVQTSSVTDSVAEPSVMRYEALTYDAGKCIYCGICVRLTEKSNTRCVFSFMGRGASTTLGIPVDEPVDEAFRRIIPELEANCPTGALAIKSRIPPTPFGKGGS